MGAWTWTKTTKYLRTLLRGSFGQCCSAVSVIKFWILRTCQRIGCWKGHEEFTSDRGAPLRIARARCLMTVLIWP